MATAALLCQGAAAATLTYCSPGSPQGFDVAQYETIETIDASIPVHEQLLALKPGSTEVVPSLAERWQVSPDGLQVTLDLRPGVKFQHTPWFKPTREMNADDVLWSIQRINDAQHPAHAAAPGGFPYWAGMSMHLLLKSVEKLSDLRVRFTLTRPEAPFLADLTMPALATVYSAEYGEQLRAAGKLAEFNTRPVGTGPYQLKSYRKDAEIRYVPHASYWGPKPALNQLVFTITLDGSVRLQRLKAGECMVGDLPPGYQEALKGDARFATVVVKPLATNYLAPNSGHRFLSDPRFRKALSLAIDRAALVRVVYGGNATPASSFLPPAMWSHDASLTHPFDPAQARALVKASGYDGRVLSIFALAKKASVLRAVELLQADWARVGIQVKPHLMEQGELLKRTSSGEHDLALMVWYSDNGDPDNFLTPNLSCEAAAGGGSRTYWCNKAFDALLEQARSGSDLEQRTTLYRQAQKLLHEEMGLIPLVHDQETVAVDQRVSGFQATLFGGRNFNRAQVGTGAAGRP